MDTFALRSVLHAAAILVAGFALGAALRVASRTPECELDSARTTVPANGEHACEVRCRRAPATPELRD